MPNLSNVFKYISQFRHAGHQVGRKVGDMLEVLTYAAISNETELLARLHVEPKVLGFSSAAHKVEFTFLRDSQYDLDGVPVVRNGGTIDDLSQMFAFVECKKVGVEQTVNSSFKKKHPKSGARTYAIPYGKQVKITFAPRGAQRHDFLVEVGDDHELVVTKDGVEQLSECVGSGHRIIFVLSTDGTTLVIGNDGSLRDFPGEMANCRILEIAQVNADNYDALLNDCLPGPQTPEKAKQASFVALDVRKLRFGSFDKRDNENELLSVLVLTEFAHWESKSQKMVKACIDKNLVVADELIVDAFQRFEDQFGADFYNQITKEQFENNEVVREIAKNLVGERNGKIFEDIEDNVRKKFDFEPNRLIISS